MIQQIKDFEMKIRLKKRAIDKVLRAREEL